MGVQSHPVCSYQGGRPIIEEDGRDYLRRKTIKYFPIPDNVTNSGKNQEKT